MQKIINGLLACTVFTALLLITQLIRTHNIIAVTDLRTLSGSQSEALAIDVDTSNINYLPLILAPDVFGEPNDSCSDAFAISSNRSYDFLPEDRDDWYVVVMYGSPFLSEELSIELRNFQPEKGQLAIFKGESCGTVEFLENVGDDNTTKIINLGSQDGGKYYIYVSNDGALNNTDAYQLYVRFE